MDKGVDAKKYFRKRLTQLDLAVKELKQDFEKLETTDKEYDLFELLSNQEYRYRVAMDIASSNKEAAKLLGLSDRHFFRLKKQYG